MTGHPGSNQYIKARRLGQKDPTLSDEGREKLRQSNRRRTLERWSKLDPELIKTYRTMCRFRFSLNSFPEEFDCDMIKEFGWYVASNRGGDGKSGVSRDHRISIRWGFDHNIPPEHIRHPANCQLMLHSTNLKKSRGCGITYEDLLDRIKNWDLKYGKRDY